MSKVFRDNVDVVADIGNQSWAISEAKVEISRKTAPNYVKMPKIIPENPNYFDDVQELRGESFRLLVNNELIPTRDTQAEKENVLFAGNVANISSRGNGAFDATAYDPSQSALNELENGGNLLNKEISITSPTKDIDEIVSLGSILGSPAAQGTVYDDGFVTVKASRALEQVIEQTPIEESEIQLQEQGKIVSGPTGEVSGSVDLRVQIPRSNVTVEKVLNILTEATNSTWWFDKKGVFYFGLPEPLVHKPKFITDTTAGLTTPPYQSIKIVGSDVASEEGISNSVMNDEEQVVYAANLGLTEEDEVQLSDVVPPTPSNELTRADLDQELNQPTFIYRSNEIISAKQAKNVGKKFGKDLAKQYAKGKVTTVGYPEISLFDVVLLPHANDDFDDKGNYQEEQPMGGGKYAVNKIIHKINPTDGFITEIHVGGVTGPASVILTEDEKTPVPSVGATAAPVSAPGDILGSGGAASEVSEATAEARKIKRRENLSNDEVFEDFATDDARTLMEGYFSNSFGEVKGSNPAAQETKQNLSDAVRNGEIDEITKENVKKQYQLNVEK